jgi:hypothetical protein
MRSVSIEELGQEARNLSERCSERYRMERANRHMGVAAGLFALAVVSAIFWGALHLY